MTKPTKWHVRPAKTPISLAGCTLILLVLSCRGSTNKPGSREVPQTENVSFQSIAAKKKCFASVTLNFDPVENDLRVTI